MEPITHAAAREVLEAEMVARFGGVIDEKLEIFGASSGPFSVRTRPGRS